MLKFLLDDNVPRKVGMFLASEGFEVKLVKEVDPSMSDRKLIRIAEKENRVIVSNDKDFISLAEYFGEVDMLLFDFIKQSSEVRIIAIRRILYDLKSGFGVLVLIN